MEEKARRWRRPEAPRQASGSIRNRREAVKEKGAMNTPARETAGEQGWVLELLGKLLKGWSNVKKNLRRDSGCKTWDLVKQTLFSEEKGE